jgi:hypothetical protein
MSLFAIYGQVIDQKTGKGIVGATAIIDTVSESIRTNTIQFGAYVIDVKSNIKSRLTFQAKGYYPKTRGNIAFSSRHFLRVDVTLEPITLPKEKKFNFGPKIRPQTNWVTLETIIINTPQRVEYSNRLKTWKVIK